MGQRSGFFLFFSAGCSLLCLWAFQWQHGNAFALRLLNSAAADCIAAGEPTRLNTYSLYRGQILGRDAGYLRQRGIWGPSRPGLAYRPLKLAN